MLEEEVRERISSILEENTIGENVNGVTRISVRGFLLAIRYSGVKFDINKRFNGGYQWEHILVYDGKVYKASSRDGLSLRDLN